MNKADETVISWKEEKLIMNKIYCFVNSGMGTDWQKVLAVANDGHVLASHISSHKTWAQHDIGLTSNWKHDIYKEHFPDGYELEWVESEEVLSHEGIIIAMKLNEELGKVAELAEEQKSGVAITVTQ